MSTGGRLSGVASVMMTIGGAAAWAYAPSLFPEYAKAAFWGGFLCTATGVCLALFIWLRKLKENTVGEDKKAPIVGLDIQNSDGGIGMDIQSHGSPGNPSTGGESIAYAPSGESVIGTRVVQRGPGTGMRVVQSGPGVGFRSVVIVGKPEQS